jgi:hypothetical protein
MIIREFTTNVRLETSLFQRINLTQFTSSVLTGTEITKLDMI